MNHYTRDCAGFSMRVACRTHTLLRTNYAELDRIETPCLVNCDSYLYISRDIILCGCNRCDKRMDRMISADGRRGEIPHLVWTLRETGAQIVYLGYLRSPGRGSIIEHCRDEGDELERRIGRLSALLDGVHFLPVADMVPEGDRSYHALDMIHPSLKASSEIGGKVADLIRAATPDSQVRVRRPGSEPASGTVRHGLRP